MDCLFLRPVRVKKFSELGFAEKFWNIGKDGIRVFQKLSNCVAVASFGKADRINVSETAEVQSIDPKVADQIAQAIAPLKRGTS